MADEYGFRALVRRTPAQCMGCGRAGYYALQVIAPTAEVTLHGCAACLARLSSEVRKLLDRVEPGRN